MFSDAIVVVKNNHMQKVLDALKINIRCCL